MTVSVKGRYRIKFRPFRRDLFWLPWQKIEYATNAPDAVAFGKYNGLPIVRIETDKAKTSANVLFYDIKVFGAKVYGGYAKIDELVKINRGGAEVELLVKVSGE